MKYKNIILCLLAAMILPTLAVAKPDKGDGDKKGKGFGKLDSNGDEVITLEEAKAAGAERLVEHFSEIDADGSGEVTKEELRNHHKQRMQERKSEGKGEGKKGKAMDTDGNGAISLEEATNAGAEKLVENFKKIDGNGDGELDRAEMKQLREKMRKEKKGGGEE
jgi:Ca2+-binding EF-hand superfamily protein